VGLKMRIIQVDTGKIFFNVGDEIVIVNDDFLVTDVIRVESVDLIVTSPPYNVDIQYGSLRDNIPYEKYLEFTERWLQKALELVKPDGRMCLNIPLDKSKGRREEGF
jgi:site-specific DNA-methyltransferase (adenine-specific)